MTLLTLAQAAAFLPAAVLITLSPGPDNLMILSLGMSRGRRQGMAFGLDRMQGLFVWQRRWLMMEERIGLERQLIPGEMRGPSRKGVCKVSHGVRHRLVRQAMHEIQIEIVETCGFGRNPEGTG